MNSFQDYSKLINPRIKPDVDIVAVVQEEEDSLNLEDVELNRAR